MEWKRPQVGFSHYICLQIGWPAGPLEVMRFMQKALLLNERDSVAVALTDLKAGETVKVADLEINLLDPVKAGHKFAVARLEEGGEVIKYGHPIGRATRTILPGQWVHTHNLKSGLEHLKDYAYHPRLVSIKPQLADRTPSFLGYPRPDGSVGIRNEIWIIPTVGCVTRLAENLADLAARHLKTADLDGIHALKHPYGCSQLGQDHQNTRKLLASLCHHPNAAGVLVLGLGCENNRIEEFKEVLGDYDPRRVKFLLAQEAGDEMEEGLKLLEELAELAGRATRAPFPVSELKVGLKCGGSDAFSGITANPLVGLVAEEVVAWGGTSVLTEVPEMFGAETILMDRALDRDIFAQMVALINGWKKYYLDHGQPVYENPSPGNREGGITTLEEKSLGCVQKGGNSCVVDVLSYGDRTRVQGLNVLSAPGNDLVSSTALAAAGCQLILFTTGRGTPFGTCVPTVKIASNSRVYNRKAHWFDFNAGRILEGEDMKSLARSLLDLVLEVASGRRIRAEEMGFREIAIFKTGVTL